MSREIRRRPAANRDLVSIFRYYAQEAGIRVADRFFDRAEAAFSQLAAMPDMGTPYEPEEPLFDDVRYFPIIQFKKYLVFYKTIPGGIEVYRVLHGARDIHGILGGDFAVDDEEGGGE